MKVLEPNYVLREHGPHGGILDGTMARILVHDVCLVDHLAVVVEGLRSLVTNNDFLATEDHQERSRDFVGLLLMKL